MTSSSGFSTAYVALETGLTFSTVVISTTSLPSVSALLSTLLAALISAFSPALRSPFSSVLLSLPSFDSLFSDSFSRFSGFLSRSSLGYTPLTTSDMDSSLSIHPSRSKLSSLVASCGVSFSTTTSIML